MNLIVISLKLLELNRRIFEYSTKDPLKTQHSVLLQYLQRNKNTEYGRAHNFATLRTIDDFRRSVPLNDFEMLRPYVDRMARGEHNILTKDTVIFFGATSGTTNKPKLIPTTAYSEKKKEDLMNLWSYYISRDHPDLLDGKILAIVSPAIEGKTEAGIPFGAESGYSYRSLPKPVMSIYALPYKVFEIEDYEARHYAILRIAMGQNITTIATLNPNMIVLLCHKIARWQDRIITDIEQGTLSEEVSITPHIRKALLKSLRPDPGRAAELKKILSKTGKLLPKDFWPNMKVIECWQAGMMKLYLKELDSYFGRLPKHDIGCVSTEARNSIPITDNTSGGVLAILTNFYEFIPKEDMAKGLNKTLLCTELKVGKEYFIIVTTAGGLYRYNIDDVVKVVGFYNKTPIIEFVQKGLGSSSLAGEKLYESHISEAVAKVIEKEEITLEFFCAVATPTGGPHYEFLVEFSGPTPPEKEAVRFLTLLEEAIRTENREYDFVRNAQLLNNPVLKIVRAGSFEHYRSRRITEGAQEGQFKAPELTADPAFVKNFDIEKTVFFGA